MAQRIKLRPGEKRETTVEEKHWLARLDMDYYRNFYTLIAVGMGLIGFVIFSLLLGYVFPELDTMQTEWGEFMLFMAWVAGWVTYIAGYIIAAVIGWLRIYRSIHKMRFGYYE